MACEFADAWRVKGKDGVTVHGDRIALGPNMSGRAEPPAGVRVSWPLRQTFSTCCAIVALVVTAVGANCAIIYRDIPDVTVNASTPEYALDVDGDGSTDLSLGYSSEDSRVTVTGALLVGGENGELVDLDSGTVLGPAAPAPVTIAPAGFLIHGFAEDGFLINFSGVALFSARGSGYLGLAISAGDDWLCGWARVDDQGESVTLYDVAYENVPRQGIVAGAVPEPHAAGLIGVVACSLLMQRRTRRSGVKLASAAPQIPRPGRRRHFNAARSAGLTFAASSLLAMVGTASGAIIYRDIPDVTVDASNPHHVLDIDGNGVIDLRVSFVVSEGRVHVSSTVLIDLGFACLLDAEAPCPDKLAVLSTGSPIHGYVPPIPGSEGDLDSGFLSPFGGPAVFTGRGHGYMGVATEETEPRVGWVRVLDQHSSVRLFDLAYETELGATIFAGAIPEPNVAGLILLACAASLLRRRRRPLSNAPDPRQHPRMLACSVAAALIAAGGGAEGAIIYRDIPDVTVNASNPSRSVDLDADGSNDLHLSYSSQYGRVFVQGVRVLADTWCIDPNADGDHQADNNPLPLVPCNPVYAWLWEEGIFFPDLSHDGDLHLNDVHSGPALLSGGYLPFYLATGRVGWARFSNGGSTLHDFAYESDQGVGIVTGAIPESRTLPGLMLCAIGLTLRRRPAAASGPHRAVLPVPVREPPCHGKR